MLDSDEGETKKSLKKKWKELKDEKKIIYDNFMNFTENELSRRHDLQIQWTNNEEQDAVTELTAQTSNDNVRSPTRSNVTSTSTKPAEVSLSTARSRSLSSNTAVPGKKTIPLKHKMKATYF